MNQDEFRQSMRMAISSSLGVNLPEIRILFYTDDPQKVHENPHDPRGFGVFQLEEHLRVHSPAFAKVIPKVISRNSVSTHNDQPLDKVLACEMFDEIWFFGMHQKNKEPYSLKFPHAGGPHSELECVEVDLLESLMSRDDGNPGIGVMMAGDHANPPPDITLPLSGDQFCPDGIDHQTFLSLGRAIGHKVPRAGLLRKWEGPPTHCCDDSFNTQVFLLGSDPAAGRFEIDGTPQKLDLQRFDPDGTPNPQGQPHLLFTGRNGQFIDVFPDHMHEGEVIIPGELDCKRWPSCSGLQPQPRILAEGTDKRDNSTRPVVAAYDGDAVNRGRVVADSSWHHYFNLNLEPFPPDSAPGTAGDLIGQFYGNLVVWLAPLSVRVEMGKLMLTWVATHPRMMEEAGSGPLQTGNAAYGILLTVSSPCEINELLAAVCPAERRGKFESLNLLDNVISTRFPSRQILLGAILEHHYYLVTCDKSDASTRVIDADVIEAGFNRAFELAAESAKIESMMSGVARVKCKGMLRGQIH